MADVKISALPAVTTPADTDEFAINQSGASKKITLAQAQGTVATLAAMTALVPADGATVYCRGRTADSDGFQGRFIFNSALVAANENGGTLIADDANDGLWVRDYNGPLRPLWFNNDLDAMLLIGEDILFGQEQTIVTEDLVVGISVDNIIIDLNGGSLTASASSTTNLIALWGDNITIRNGTIDGDNQAGGNHAVAIYGDDCVLSGLTIVDADQDAIWTSDSEATAGTGNRLLVENVTITNPGRHGILMNVTNAVYNDWVKLKNVTYNKDAGTNNGIQIPYVNSLIIDGCISTTGWVTNMALTYIKHAVVSNCVFDETGSFDSSSECIDFTYVENVTVRDCRFHNKKRAMNPSNTSDKVTINNNWIENCREGIITYENFDDVTISNNKFYGIETAINTSNSSMSMIINNYMYECELGINLTGNNVDGKTNYANMIAIVTGNVFEETGDTAVYVRPAIANSYFDLINISNNTFYNVHTMTAAKSWWVGYTAIDNTVEAISISITSGTYNGRVIIHNNSLTQDSDFASGVGGGGAETFLRMSSIDFLSIKANVITKFVDKCFVMTAATVTEFESDEYLESSVIDLSGAAYDLTGYPQKYNGYYLGVEVVYTETCSSDAGIDIEVEDGITGTVKKTVTTTPSAAAGTVEYFPMSNVSISTGRNIAIDGPGGKTGAGEVYIRVYYVSTV